MKNIPHEGQKIFVETYSTCLYRFLGRCPNCTRDYDELIEELSKDKLEDLAN